MTLAARTRLTRWFTGGFLGFPVVQGLSLSLVSNPFVRGFLSDLIQALCAVGVAGTMAVLARCGQVTGAATSRGWTLVAWSAGFWAAGAILSLVAGEEARWPARPGLPDLFFFLFYPAVILGLWRLPAERSTRREHWNAVLELAAMGVLGAVVVWQLSRQMLVRNLASGVSVWTGVALGYTVADVVLLMVVYWRLSGRLARGGQLLPMVMVVLGCLCLITSDLLRGYSYAYPESAGGAFSSLGRVLFLAFFGLASCWALRSESGPSAAAIRETGVEKYRTVWTLTLTYMWIGLGVAFLIWAVFHHAELKPGLWVAGVAAATVLAITRQIATLRENHELYQALRASADQLERRASERATELGLQSERLRLALEATNDGIWEWELPTNEAYFSPRWFTMLGYQPGALPSRFAAWIELTHPDDVLRVQAVLQEAVGKRTAFEVDFRLRAADGSWRWILARGRVSACDAQGRPVRISGTNTDITERKQSEQRILLLGFALDNVHEAAYLMDETGRLLYANQEASRSLGYTSKELLGLRATDLDPDFPVTRWTTHWQDLRSRRSLTFESRHRAKDGRVLSVEVNANFFEFDGRGYSLALVRDITDRKRLEAKYLRAQRLESVGTLASGVAHDLNNILSPIIMGVDILKETHQDQSSQTLLAVMRESAGRGSDTVRQLLTFARGTESQPGLVQPRHLLKEIVLLVRQTFPKDIQIVTEVGQDPAMVMADPSQIHQVLMNLCVNARDAMPDGGVMTITLENKHLDQQAANVHPKARPGSYVVFRVTDTGMGIKPEHLDRIFDPFFTTKPQGLGTGLGLATVLGIVENHRGFVLVESRPGQGAAFEVYLPATPAVETTSRPPELPPTPAAHGELVLVVDDESSIRHLVERVLQATGYRTLGASCGSEALQLFEQNRERIRVVVTDMMMPFGDGRRLVAALCARAPELPIVAMSGVGTEELQKEITQLGARTFLTKPFSVEQLLTAVNEVLNSGRA